MNILSIGVRAKSVGISGRTLERQIEDGIGPVVIQVSPRRKGISDPDWDAWLESRRNAPAAEKRGRGRPRKALAG